MRFCKQGHAMRRDTRSGQLLYVCPHCAETALARSDELRVGGEASGDLAGLHRRLLANAGRNPVNAQVAIACPTCGIDHVSMIFLPGKVPAYRCYQGHAVEPSPAEVARLFGDAPGAAPSAGGAAPA